MREKLRAFVRRFTICSGVYVFVKMTGTPQLSSHSGHLVSKTRVRSHFCAGVLLCLFLPCVASAQRPRQQQGFSPPIGTESPRNGSITVVVVSTDGSTLGVQPNISIFSNGINPPLMSIPSKEGENEWVFRNLEVGEQYTIQVDAKGFESEQQYVNLPHMFGATERTRIYLYPKGARKNSTVIPSGRFLLAPAAQREVQQAVKDLKSNKIAKAQKHLRKALRLAPNHPGVNYLMGLSYLREHQRAQAISYLEKSISMDPGQVPANLALGILRYDQHDYAVAIQRLEKVIAQRPASWQARSVLASSYLCEQNYEQARIQARKALKAGKREAQGARLVLGQALAGLGKRKQATKVLEKFLKQNRHDPSAGRVRALIKELRRPPAPKPPAETRMSAVTAKHSPAPSEALVQSAQGMTVRSSAPVASQPAAKSAVTAPPAQPIQSQSVADLWPKEDWAPPDVDAMQPVVTEGAACSLPSILHKAGEQAVAWVKELQKFSATEHYQSVEINHKGVVGRPFVQNFRYLVFVNKIGSHFFVLDELRQPTPNLDQMGAPVIGLGTPGLALVFHPNFRSDFAWSCDGLGKWKGEPAWIVRFAQLPGHKIARLMSVKTPKGSQLLALKGLAWLSKKSDQVIHLEMDLVKPINALDVQRDHFSISYRMVKFHSHPVELWLPERVDMYVLYRDHAYHNHSRFSHFELFWTGTKSPTLRARSGNTRTGWRPRLLARSP